MNAPHITGAFAAGMAGNPGGVMNADPFNPFLIAHSLYNPALQFIPGTDDGELHNLNTIDGGKGSSDPRTMNNRHNAPPGVRLDNSNVDRSGIPNYQIPVGVDETQFLQLPAALPPIPESLNQSSNLQAAKSINQSGSGIPGAAGNIAGQITEDQRRQFAMENPGSKSQIAGGLFQPGAGLFGGVRRLLG